MPPLLGPVMRTCTSQQIWQVCKFGGHNGFARRITTKVLDHIVTGCIFVKVLHFDGMWSNVSCQTDSVRWNCGMLIQENSWYQDWIGTSKLACQLDDVKVCCDS